MGICCAGGVCSGIASSGQDQSEISVAFKIADHVNLMFKQVCLILEKKLSCFPIVNSRRTFFPMAQVCYFRVWY